MNHGVKGGLYLAPAGLTAGGNPDLPQAGWFENIRANEDA
jgi:hypothetical protein